MRRDSLALSLLLRCCWRGPGVPPLVPWCGRSSRCVWGNFSRASGGLQGSAMTPSFAPDPSPQGLSRDSAKRLRFVPGVVYVDGMCRWSGWMACISRLPQSHLWPPGVWTPMDVGRARSSVRPSHLQEGFLSILFIASLWDVGMFMVSPTAPCQLLLCLSTEAAACGQSPEVRVKALAEVKRFLEGVPFPSHIVALEEVGGVALLGPSCCPLSHGLPPSHCPPGLPSATLCAAPSRPGTGAYGATGGVQGRCGQFPATPAGWGL